MEDSKHLQYHTNKCMVHCKKKINYKILYNGSLQLEHEI
jgi:hypothetical protein